jgi:threonine dehydrogenase-like Zn-dependent dehydrogenase
VKALSFHYSLPRLAAAKVLGAVFPGGNLLGAGPLRYAEVPDPRLPAKDWAIVQVQHTGICGSDVKQVFLEGAFDNPLTALISFPHVLGHEIVGTVVEAGPEARRVKKGDRVAVYAWLSCAVRGLPLCPACANGDFTLCENLAGGAFAPGMHAGNCRDLPGGFAPFLAAHDSMCFPLRDALGFKPAALADPFAVCLRAIGKAPPRAGETALVFGMGSLGVLLAHLLVRLYPCVRVLGVDVSDATRDVATKLGIEHFLTDRGSALVERLGELTGAKVQRPWGGLPFLQGGVDRVYDTVGSGRSLEAGIRVLRPKGTLVLVGVAPPERFEWTPIYFKELNVIGSNGCAFEDFEGQRKHSFDVYLDLLARGRIDPSPMVTHELPLSEYRRGFMTARDKTAHRSIKVLLSPTPSV